MEKIRIWDGKNSDPGSEINSPDPQHCWLLSKQSIKIIEISNVVEYRWNDLHTPS
jgi:hypothetical protein